MIQKIKLFIGKICVKLIRFLSRRAKIDLIPIAYSENGITKSYSYFASGEKYFIEQELKKHISSKSPVLIDVGGNKGDYALMLHSAFPAARIFSLEPNPKTFEHLEKNAEGKFTVINKGLGNSSSTLQLFFDKNDKTSVQASSDPEILRTIAGTTELEKVDIDVVTLDEFCKENSIEKIDLLKIDTEGFELEVLEGADVLLEKNAIKVIQFEFNEVNIVKRRFLKDFYDRLPGFSFYRLDEKRMIPLDEWKPKHEIFLFQNIVAVLD